jgi:ABC-type sugar transport system ATPase subunit
MWMMVQESSTPSLELFGIGKIYSGTRVLQNIDIDLYPGEVHALVGENGAGKSTLSKIISGVVQKSEGTMHKNSIDYSPINTHEAISKGISIVHQEFNLIPVLDIAQNIALGKEKSIMSYIIENDSTQRAEKLLKQLNLDVSVRKKVSQLSIAQQQLVELAKCLADNSEIIIMDEPTATLTYKETKNLFEIIKNLSKKGVAIIYISHKLEEIFSISQRITVLRDGKKIGTYKTSEMDHGKLVNLMVGREISSMYEHINKSKPHVILQVRDLSKTGIVSNINFELKEGEILGFGGLVGAGRTELMKMIYGELPFDTGEIELLGRKIKRLNPRKMVNYGLAYLPEDRKEEGIIANLGIKENITLATLNKYKNLLSINGNLEREATIKMIRKLAIKSSGISQQVGHLSGGNQQKVVLGKWLLSDVKVLILDEPTRGIDIGAKHEIYKLMNELSQQGMAIIMISSEMPELIGMCDRVYVMCEGRITKELSGSDINETNIMAAAAQRGYQI